MRKRRLRATVFVCAFMLFLVLMDYPYLSRLYNDIISGEVALSIAKSEEDEDCSGRLMWAEAYNRYLTGEGVCPAENPEWTEGTSWDKAVRVLCVKEPDLAGWIRISSLELILPLYVGTGDEALEKGAGILEQRSLPVGGESTHACISAHRGLPDRTLFTNLDMLRKGDLIEVHTLGRTICYEVYGDETVRPTDTKPLAIQPGQDLLTLITCTPYGINSHRLYVHARRCPDRSEKAETSGPVHTLLTRFMNPVFWKLWWWVPATVFLLLFLILLVRRSLR